MSLAYPDPLWNRAIAHHCGCVRTDRLFNEIKHYRRIVTSYEKHANSSDILILTFAYRALRRTCI
jgi:hypothetical protein